MHTLRLVLADDHSVVRAGIADALRALPQLEIVAELDHGGALLATLEREQPDLLVTDVTMPGFDPIPAITQIRARFPLLKILIVSAYDDDVYVQGLLGVGVHGYHLKDQPLGDLHLAVQRVVAGERWICAPVLDKLVQQRPLHPAPALTARQRDVLKGLRDGLDNQTIARRTGLSVKTVENHLTRLYRHLNVQSRMEAVMYLIQHPDLMGLPAPPSVTARPGDPAYSTADATILVVDDNMRYRTQLQRMLGKSCPNVHLVEAENLRVALQLVPQVQPRLAFVDVVLGDESGIECARRIKDLSPTTRVVLISAYPDREFHRRGLEAGAVAFLDKKDLDAATLRAVVDDQIG